MFVVSKGHVQYHRCDPANSKDLKVRREREKKREGRNEESINLY